MMAKETNGRPRPPLAFGILDPVTTDRFSLRLEVMLFTTNQLRQFVKVLLTGNWQMGGTEFEKSAADLFGATEETFNEDVFAKELEKAIAFLNTLTDAIPQWRKIAGLRGISSNAVRDLRQEGHVCLSVSGLVILAKIGHELFKENVADWRQYAEKLGQLEWSKSGKLWQGNVVATNGRILTHQNLIRQAITKVRDAIGWQPSANGDLPQIPMSATKEESSN